MAKKQEGPPLTDKSLEALSSELNRLVEEKLGERKFVGAGPFQPGEIDPDILGAWIVRGEPEAQSLERFNHVALRTWREKYTPFPELVIIYLAEKPIIQTFILSSPFLSPKEFENLFERTREALQSDPRNRPRPAEAAELKQAIESLSKVNFDPRYSAL